jgi:hypothetical protein
MWEIVDVRFSLVDCTLYFGGAINFRNNRRITIGSVPEMPDTCKDHCQAQAVGSIYDFLVAD